MQKLQQMLPKLPKLHKSPRLKPLLLSDIMIAFINQEHTVDHTEEYKRMLGLRWKSEGGGQVEREEELVLPQFAKRDYTPAQILDYHIKKKDYDTTAYEAMLAKVDGKIGLAMQDYDGKLREGQQGIESLMDSLGEGCRKIEESRRCLEQCKDKLRGSYSKVAPALRKIANISKVIEILSVWGKSKIPYLFSIDTSQPYLYNIGQVLDLLQSAKASLRSNPSTATSSSLKSILHSLQQKQSLLLNNIRSIFLQSIIKFTTGQQYSTKYIQYLTIVGLGLTGNVLTMQGIKGVIQQNGKAIFYATLGKLTTSVNNNVDTLNQVAFLEFYQQVMEEFVIYFSSWHRVTTYHVDNGTGHQGLFLENRKQVFVSFSQRIAHSIENSRKFMSLEYKIKLQLVEKLQDFMEAGEKWMGTYENLLLPKIVIGKLSSQLQSIFALYNNMIKNILSQQISVLALQAVDEPKPLHTAKSSYHIADINYTKVSAFLCSHSMSKQYLEGIEKIYEKIQEPPLVRLKIGEVFTQMIGEYLERSKYLEANKSIYLLKILEHFEFILSMLYQLCLRESIKRRITTDILAELMENEKQKNEEVSAISLKKLNELAQINMAKREYAQVLEFLNSCGTKYDGIKIVGIVDVNKVYEANNETIETSYVKVVSLVVSELVRILRWLVSLLPNTHLRAYRQCSKIAKLQHTLLGIYSLFLQNGTEQSYRKYTQTIPPIMNKLKWQIKKFNQETANLYKEYKNKILQIFRKTSVLAGIRGDCPELVDLVSNKEVECLYRALLDCYGRIEKINDNGRQLIRLDCIEVARGLGEMGAKCEVWVDWFDKYLDLTSERNYKIVLEKLTHMGLFYEPTCWKYQLMWVVGDLSSKEKREYNAGIAQIYMDFLKN